MVPVIARLAGERNFHSIYKYGRRLRGANLNLSYLKVPQLPTRVAVVVSKQVSNKATKRNLYKRRLWASLRGLRQYLPKTGYNLVVSARASVKTQTYAALNRELIDILKQLRSSK